MAKTKLTLTAEKRVIEIAKKAAAKQNTSLSAMFSRMVSAMADAGADASRLPPITQAASGLVCMDGEKTSRELLESGLLSKYGLDE